MYIYITLIVILTTNKGMGLILGPIIGAGLYEIFSDRPGLAYQMVFYVICIVFSLIIYPSVIMLPKERPLTKKPPTLSLLKVMCNRRILCLFFVLTACSFSLTYTYPLWTPHY
jgi:MFS family permease